MSRKSRSRVPGIDFACQVRPPSIVRSTVPWVPLAQTTLESTTQRPRNRVLVPLTWAVHWAWDVASDKETASRAISMNLAILATASACMASLRLMESSSSPETSTTATRSRWAKRLRLGPLASRKSMISEPAETSNLDKALWALTRSCWHEVFTTTGVRGGDRGPGPRSGSYSLGMRGCDGDRAGQDAGGRIVRPDGPGTGRCPGP